MNWVLWAECVLFVRIPWKWVLFLWCSCITFPFLAKSISDATVRIIQCLCSRVKICIEQKWWFTRLRTTLYKKHFKWHFTFQSLDLGYEMFIRTLTKSIYTYIYFSGMVTSIIVCIGIQLDETEHVHWEGVLNV